MSFLKHPRIWYSSIFASISARRPGPLSRVVDVVAAAELHLRELRSQLRVRLPVDPPAEAQVGVLHLVALPEQILQRFW